MLACVVGVCEQRLLKTISDDTHSFFTDSAHITHASLRLKNCMGQQAVGLDSHHVDKPVWSGQSAFGAEVDKKLSTISLCSWLIPSSSIPAACRIMMAWIYNIQNTCMKPYYSFRLNFYWCWGAVCTLSCPSADWPPSKLHSHWPMTALRLSKDSNCIRAGYNSAALKFGWFSNFLFELKIYVFVMLDWRLLNPGKFRFIRNKYVYILTLNTDLWGWHISKATYV